MNDELCAFDGFTVGEPMTSLDLGKTWIPTWMLPEREPGPGLYVIKVDHEAGVITLGEKR